MNSKPVECTWAYDLGIIAPHKFAFRFVITQLLEGPRENDEISGKGDYYTNTYYLPAAFGQWKLIESLWTYAHPNFYKAFNEIPNQLEKISKLRFVTNEPRGHGKTTRDLVNGIGVKVGEIEIP